MFQDFFDLEEHIRRALAVISQPPVVTPLQVSPWVAMSAIQKAIRRGDTDLAVRAALTLQKSDPARLWRRLAGIVFEDIGLADLECVALVVSATSRKRFRQQFGTEFEVAGVLVTRMCIAKKCRVADDLFVTVANHFALEALRAATARKTPAERLSYLEDGPALLGASLAALHAAGVHWKGQMPDQHANPSSLFTALLKAGILPQVVELARQGFRRTREALPIMMALASRAIPSEALWDIDDEFPPVTIGCNGIPTYCLDGFSREGQSAIFRFLRRDSATSRWFKKHVPAQRRVSVLAGGLFRIEGGLIRRRIDWPAAKTLRRLADYGYHGMHLSDASGLLDMIRADLPKLDAERGIV